MITKNTAGSLYVRYLTLGGALLLTLIWLPKLFSASMSTIMLAAGIVLTTALAVGLYTLAVSREESLLAELDAPDFAYYLGFSLTVTALSLTFLTDLRMSQATGDLGQVAAANVSRNTLDRALAQFGAGLLATLFGLCAKIWLSSKQQRQSQDPAMVASKFRAELAEFSQLIQETSQALASSIQSGCSAINSASLNASQSIEALATQLTSSAESLSKSFNAERLGTPIRSFLSELDKVVISVSGLREEMGVLGTEIKSVNALISNHETAITADIKALNAHEQATSGNVTATAALSSAVANLLEVAGKLKRSLATSAAAIESLTAPVAKLIPTFDAVNAKTLLLDAASSKLTGTLNSVEIVVTEQAVQLSKLSATTATTDATLRSLGLATQAVEMSLKNGRETMTSWNDALRTSGSSIKSTEAAAEKLRESLLQTTDIQKKTNQEFQSSVQIVLSLNRALTDIQSELKKVAGVLTLAESSAADLATKFRPLSGSAVQTELTLRLLNKSLEATKSVVASLNISADDLSKRLKGLGRDPTL